VTAPAPAPAPVPVLGPRPAEWAASDPRVCRVDGPLTAALLAGLEPWDLAQAGRERLVLTEPVRLGTDDECDVRFVRLLRESLSATVRVEWTAESIGSFPAALVSHLPPPSAGVALRGENGIQWRDGYRFGRCYYRIGPEFVLIKDMRQGDDRGARYRLDGAEVMGAFPGLEQALYLPAAPAPVRELFELLTGEELVLRRGDWGTVLPFRMRRWPVPFSSV
jgi:hypothetical protein